MPAIPVIKKGLKIGAPVIKKGLKIGAQATNARLTPFLRGVAYGLSLAGYTLEDIAAEIRKPGGCNASQQAIAATISMAEQNGGVEWDGEHHSGAGRPRAIVESLDKDILSLVYKHRGSCIVTAPFVRRMVKSAKAVSLRTLQRRIGDAGLAWFRRRRKCLVPSIYKEQRLVWSAWVLARTALTLARWVYSDGTVFYLARTVGEAEDKKTCIIRDLRMAACRWKRCLV